MEEQKSKLAGFQGESNLPETIPSFLLKTYEILENEKYEDIICWTKSGEGFIVKKVKEFADNVLPIYFRHSNYTSFVRQLNMYDFHKTRQENHENAFKNTMFKRGFKHLLKDIQRKDYKKNKENTKEIIPSQKNAPEKAKESSKNQRSVDSGNDNAVLAASKLAEMNEELEQKALLLASLREMPERELEVIRLLDVLYEAKRLQREMLEKMTAIENLSIDTFKHAQKQSPAVQADKWEPKIEWTTAESKASGEVGKEDRLSTYSTLFASFRMA